MPTRNTQSARLQKLQQQMQAEVKRKMDEAAANEEETLGSKRRRRSGKPKGATHGRDNAPQRTTFGSEEMFDTRGLSTSQIRSLQPGDNPQRDGVGDCFAHNAPPKEGGIDLARGKGKNGLAEESDSEDEPEDGTGGKGRWELEDQPSPNAGLRRFSQQESCQEDRLPHPGRSPFREPSNVHRVAADVLALKSRSGSAAGSGQGSGVVHQELALRAEEVEDSVAISLIRPKRGDDISIERAMAVACLQGNSSESEMYPDRAKLVYWRAVADGMPPCGLDGVRSDPMTFLRTQKNYNYVASEHLKACSSKRGELSGTKGIRGVFEAKTSFNLSKARTPDEVAMQTALAAGLSDGKWHTLDGVPFSSDLFVTICRQVWKKDDCSLTPQQLVWTCLVVDNFLKNRSFDRSDAVNADLLDDLSQTVCDQVKAAKKAKKPIKVKMTPPDQTISLGELTDAYIMEGMSCINNAGRTKGPGKKRRGREQRNRAAFDELARLCSEDPAEAEAAEADEAETVAEAEIEAEAPPETADT